MDETAELTARRWVVLGSLTASRSVSWSAVSLLGLLLPHISKDLGLSPSEQGWLGSSSILASLLLTIPMNIWMSRYRPSRVASFAFLAVAGLVFLQGWAPVFAILILSRVGLGLAFTLFQAPRALLIQQWSSKNRLAFTNGITFSGEDLGLGLAFFITPFMLTWVGDWRNTYYLWGGICLLAALAWVVLGKERITEEYRERLVSPKGTHVSSILKRTDLWILGFGMCGAMLVESAFSVFWPTLAQEHFQISASVTGFAIGLIFFTAAPSELMVNALPIFTQRRRIVLAAFGLMLFGSHLGLVYTGSIPLVLMLSIVKGAAIAYFPVVLTIVFLFPDIRPREVAVGFAFLETSVLIGEALGPLLVGFLQEATGDLQLALTVTVFFPLTLVVTALLLRTKPVQALATED